MSFAFGEAAVMMSTGTQNRWVTRALERATTRICGSNTVSRSEPGDVRVGPAFDW